MSARRLVSMDTARGAAVVGMVALHLAPLDGPALAWLEGRPAALFCVLAGMAWSFQARGLGARFGAFVARRSAALLAAGIALHRLLWTTEVLVPLAAMLALCALVRRGGPRWLWAVAALALAGAPLGALLCGGWIATDWLADGGHRADTQIGWVSVRYLLIDGNYPLFPWLALPLVGMALADGPLEIPRLRRWFWSAVAATLAASAVGVWARSPYLALTWVPTTAPFLLAIGGFATASVCGLLWRERTAPLPRSCVALAAVGRLSLTHYLGHLCLLIPPLRGRYPGETWPMSVGAAAAALYTAAALAGSGAWLRRFPRGPLEGLLRRLSGGDG